MQFFMKELLIKNIQAHIQYPYYILLSNQFMQHPESKQDGAAQWLFSKRLQFISSQEELKARTQSVQLNQELFLNSRKYDPSQVAEINTIEQLKEVYQVLNGLIYRCRFNAKNVDQTYNKSKNQLKNKKHLKEVEKTCKNKVKRILQIIRREDEQEHWKLVLNHKNIIEHIIKANVFLKSLLKNNFQLIKEGAAHIKNQELPKQLQIEICILAIDLISLINNLRYYLLPFLQDENNANNKVELQEKIFLDNALENANEGQDFSLLKNLDINRFLVTIKRISGEMTSNNYSYKVWISIEDIRQNYLVDNFGVWKKRFHQTAAKELLLYWRQVYNGHFNKEALSDRKAIVLKNVFEDYKIMFNFYLSEANKKKEETVHVTQYLDLIHKVWVMIDKNSASNLFWEELALASKKVTIPGQYIKQSKDFIKDVINNIINTFQEKSDEEFLQKLKATVLNLSINLLKLESDEDLIEHYFLKCENEIRFLLTQRNVIDSTVKEVQKLVENLNENELFQVIKKITHKITVDAKNTAYKMEHKHEKLIIDSLYETYEDQHHLIDEIKYFLLTSRCLSHTLPSNEELISCRSYYINQRIGILSNEYKISSKDINNLKYGLLDSIRILTFELVLNIKLNKPSYQLDRLKKVIYKLLKIYQQKRRAQLQETQENDKQTEEQEIEINSLLLRRSSSVEINANHFHLELEDLEEQQIDEEKYNDFTMNYLKKIFELRVQMIFRSLNDLDEKELPLRQEFIDLKSRIYSYAASGEKDLLLREDAKKLPEIQFDFMKKRYFQAWTNLRKLKDLQGVNKILEKAWDGKRNLLKFFITTFLKYKEPVLQVTLRGKELEAKDINNLINDSLQHEHRRNNLQEGFKQNITNAIRILDSIEKIGQLKKELVEQDEQLNTLEQAKQFKIINEEVKFKQIEDKLQIHTIAKNDMIMMRKYIIKLQHSEIDEVYKKLRKLTQFNRNITLEINKQKDTIVMKIDELQNVFESYPKLVKYLIQSYLQIIQFCFKQLNFDLYPLLLHNHFKIIKKNDHNIILKINPYEGILMNIILPAKELRVTNYYNYPKYPFIEFADQLAKKFEKDRVYEHKSNLAQYNAFNHLIEEMKALSMEIQSGDIVETAKAILKCPYFWSSADKLFEIVEFKQRYQSIVNIEESRRKENEKIRESLNPQQRETFTYWPPEKKHPSYKPAFGYNKTNQVYFSIEGLIERQAFEQDIGNFKGKDSNQKYKLHGYFWSKDKTQIERLVKMVAEREKRKGSNTSFYDKTFNSFQNQIRNLRNLSVHYIYDTDQKKQIDLEDKLTIFETYFPKLFVFLYRWRPYLGKDYVNEIKIQKINFLRQIYSKQDNTQVLQRLSNIKQLQAYNIRNDYGKNYLLKLFNYDFPYINGCEPCKILCNSLKKQASFWGFLEDVKRENFKEGKDMTYNLLFWEHEKKGCNGMRNILLAYYNVTQRNQFTTEEFAHVKSSITMMQIEKDRLEKKIKKKLEKKAQMRRGKVAEGQEQGDTISDAESGEVQIKNREPVQKRFEKLTAKELDNLHEELARLDYVCKFFIYQLELKFPYLFYDLRKERYQWDQKAWQYPKKQ